MRNSLGKQCPCTYKDTACQVAEQTRAFRATLAAVDKRLAKLEKLVALTYEDEQAIDEWLVVLRDYAQLEELDRPNLLRLVKRIEVGEKYEIAGETYRDIKIYYNFVGYVEF